MVSRIGIAMRREAAFKRLVSALERGYGEPFTMPRQGRNPALLQVVQWEALADYLDRHIPPAPDAPPAFIEAALPRNLPTEVISQRPPRKASRRKKAKV